MSASKKKPSSSRAAKPAPRKKTSAPIQLAVAVRGDQRLTENLILELRAMARDCGLEIPGFKVVRQPRVKPKMKRASTRKAG